MLIGNDIDSLGSRAVNRTAAAGNQIFASFIQYRHAGHLRLTAFDDLGDIRGDDRNRTRRLLRILRRLFLRFLFFYLPQLNGQN